MTTQILTCTECGCTDVRPTKTGQGVTPMTELTDIECQDCGQEGRTASRATEMGSEVLAGDFALLTPEGAKLIKANA